uniref:Uncharacterized protein n=1 Tax=Arundo donax TaxID=35708 RepID=A0A0A8XUR0_ARUDO
MLGITAAWQLNQPSCLRTTQHFLRRRALAEVEVSMTSHQIVRPVALVQQISSAESE